SKQLFSGSCTDKKGSPRTTCFIDFRLHEVQVRCLRIIVALLNPKTCVFVNVKFVAVVVTNI
ncbi:hypothetical protein F2Q69_00034522, partial [Brassica cretica]